MIYEWGSYTWMSPQIGAILFEILGNYYRTMQYCQQFHASWKNKNDLRGLMKWGFDKH